MIVPLRSPYLWPALLASVCLAGCAARRTSLVAVPSARQETISAIQRLEADLGFEQTGNFRGASSAVKAYYHCYYTGKLELPDSYEGLKKIDGTDTGCPVDAETYDVFYYPIEAVAGTETPVTTALEEASLERLLVVVPHEDFHEDPQVQRLPTRVGESATTLIGFLTARQFALEQYGADSEAFHKVSRDAELFLRKAELVNAYHEKLSRVYADRKARRISRQEALKRKARLFDQLQQECASITPDPGSFNKCLAANNNAGLAFEVTYTKFYPLVYRLARVRELDVRATITALREVGRAAPRTEREAAELVDALNRERDVSPGS